MTTKAQAKLTRKQRAWAYKHAKEHIVEALQEALTEEHHSVVTIASAEGRASAVKHSRACLAVGGGPTDDDCICGAHERAKVDASVIHEVVMQHMERWFKAIRTERAKDFA